MKLSEGFFHSLSPSFSLSLSLSLTSWYQYGFFFAPIRSLPPVSLSHSICLVAGTAWVPSPKWGRWDGRFAISQGLLDREAVLEGKQFY